jgi:energy-coupling factor transporter ATP-binding protein EcfA2
MGSVRGCEDHPIRSFGFPRPAGLGGAFAKASVLGALNVQGVDSLQLTDSKELTSGFSGAPIWDVGRARVIGVARLVVQPDALGKLSETAFVITSECVKRTFPDLPITDECPFKALGRFTREDDRLYKGRTRAINSLLAMLATEPSFLLVTGPSGSGKSSLVRAGLLPHMERDAFPGSSGWTPYILEPDSTKPILDLVRASGIDIGAADLRTEAANWKANHPAVKRLLVIVDQFERLFSEAFDPQRADFLRSLARICSSPEWGITFLAVMRTEFYGSLLEHAPAELASALDHSTLNVPKGITDSELREIIENRPTENGWAITQDLVASMINDAVGAGESAFLGDREAVATVLPLLEFALWRLWQPDRTDDPPGQLILPRYTAKGGLYGSLVDWADQAYRALTPEKKVFARRVFTSLVRPGVKDKGVPATGQVQPLTYLRAPGPDGDRIFEVIQHLTNYHLLVSDESTVQLAHDSLISRWPLLRFWVDEDHDFLKWRTALDDLIEARLTPPSAGKVPVKQSIIHDEQLKESLGWLRSRREDIPANVIQTIERSQKVARRKTFFLWSLAALVLAFALIGALYLVQAKRRSEQALLRVSSFGSAITAANANGNVLRATALAIAGPASYVSASQIDPLIAQYATVANVDLPLVTDHFDQIYELTTGKETIAAVGSRPGLAARQLELAVWGDSDEPRTLAGAFIGLAVSPGAQLVAVGDVEKAPVSIRLYSRKLILITTITATTLKVPR